MARSLIRPVSWALDLAGFRAWRRPRCARSVGINDYLRRNQQLQIFPVCFYGDGSALDYILGISKKESQGLTGQHPPPVSAFQGEHNHLLEHVPDQPENPKILRIAVIGAPNAGKSTLVNQLLGRKVLPVSRKVHTTRCNAQGIVTKEDTQLVILDTPGLTTFSKAKRHKLEKSMLSDPFKSLEHADLVVVLVDVSDRYTRTQLHPQLLYCLSSFPQIPSVLVLNKVDLVKTKTVLLDLVTELTEGVVNGRKLRAASALKPLSSNRKPPEDPQVSVTAQNTSTKLRDTESSGAADVLYQESPVKDSAKARKGWPNFQEVFMLAAMNREEVGTLKAYLLKQARPGAWEFHSEVLTSQSPQEICDNIIREKLLEYLPEEVPYMVTQRTEVWEEGPSGELVILQKLLVPKESHVKMLIGRHGQMINQIALEASTNLMNAFLCDVCLKLSVQLQK